LVIAVVLFTQLLGLSLDIRELIAWPTAANAKTPLQI